MLYTERYNEWLLFDDETKQELLKITDEKELEDRFYKDLQFGTGGLRGIMGAGPNRMNKYTVGKATLGLAKYLASPKVALPTVYLFIRFGPAPIIPRKPPVPNCKSL